MIRAELISAVPQEVLDDLCSFARDDWNEPGWTRAIQLARVDRMWVLRHGDTPLGVVGVYRTAMLSDRNELFLLFTNAFVQDFRRHMRGLARGLRVIRGLYPNLIVKAGCGTNSRFARYFGLKTLFTLDGYDILKV